LLPSLCVFTSRDDVRALKDLEGRTVGTGSLGSLLHQLMVGLLDKYGVDSSKVKFVNIGASVDVFKATVVGTVDAGTGENAILEQLDDYKIRLVEHGNMAIELPEYTYQGGWTSERTLDRKRDTIVRVLAAYAKLYRFVQTPGAQEAFLRAPHGSSGRRRAGRAGAVALHPELQALCGGPGAGAGAAGLHAEAERPARHAEAGPALRPCGGRLPCARRHVLAELGGGVRDTFKAARFGEPLARRSKRYRAGRSINEEDIQPRPVAADVAGRRRPGGRGAYRGARAQAPAARPVTIANASGLASFTIQEVLRQQGYMEEFG